MHLLSQINKNIPARYFFMINYVKIGKIFPIGNISYVSELTYFKSRNLKEKKRKKGSSIHLT